MNRSGIFEKVLHAVGVLLVAWVAFEFLTFGRLFFPPRHFQRVEVTANIGPSPGPFWLIEARTTSNPIPRMFKIPHSDGPSIGPGENILLMTADWNIKGPDEQLVTPWRLVSAYHHWLAVAYLVLLAGRLTLRSSRTPPALPSALSLLLAISASFIVSVQAGPLSFIR